MPPVLSATEKVMYLLSTLDDARSAWESGSGGDGVTVMPTMYAEGSYKELEAALDHMRQHHRRLWWHVTARYRYGHEHWVWVGVERRDKNPHYRLPGRSVLRGVAEHEGNRAKVLLYTWSGDVDDRLAASGLEMLRLTMYQGQDWQIELPKQAFAQPGTVVAYAP